MNSSDFNMRRCLKVRQVIAVAALVLTAGCGSPTAGPETVPVTGKVTLQGEPVGGATVTLTPSASGGGNPAQAVTTDAGEFEVFSSFDQGKTTQAGMTPGEYVITVSKLESIPAQAQLVRAPKNLLPERYQSPSTSDLKAVVAIEGDNFVTVELQK